MWRKLEIKLLCFVCVFVYVCVSAFFLSMINQSWMLSFCWTKLRFYSFDCVTQPNIQYLAHNVLSFFYAMMICPVAENIVTKKQNIHFFLPSLQTSIPIICFGFGHTRVHTIKRKKVWPFIPLHFAEENINNLSIRDNKPVSPHINGQKDLNQLHGKCSQRKFIDSLIFRLQFDICQIKTFIKWQMGSEFFWFDFLCLCLYLSVSLFHFLILCLIEQRGE